VLAAVPLNVALMADVGFLHVQASVAAQATLLRGFTTVRDAGGPSFGVKQAIDAGLVRGPRIFPSGAMISQTGGHGDFRLLQDLPRGVWGGWRTPS
jgi:imidazolonepropionase-like amidohydrolase